MSPVLGYEGKDSDRKPKRQLRRCSSERSQAQIEPEAVQTGTTEGDRTGGRLGVVGRAGAEGELRLLQCQPQERWCYR